MKTSSGFSLFAVFAVGALLAPPAALASPEAVVGRWKGSGTISSATVANGKIEFLATTRVAYKVPWTKMIATVTSDNGTDIGLSVYSYNGSRLLNPKAPIVGTYKGAAETINWTNGEVWTREFDPALEKLKTAEIQSQLEAANQRAKELEMKLSQNQATTSEMVEKQKRELAQLAAAQQASDAQRLELAKMQQALNAATVGASYSVEEYWASRWNRAGSWVLGGRSNQKVVGVDLFSRDGGNTLEGKITYANEGAIDFKATHIAHNRYRAQVQWAQSGWLDENAWIIGDRPDKKVVALKATSGNGGNVLEGTMTYSGEGPIGFKGTAK